MNKLNDHSYTVNSTVVLHASAHNSTGTPALRRVKRRRFPLWIYALTESHGHRQRRLACAPGYARVLAQAAFRIVN